MAAKKKSKLGRGIVITAVLLLVIGPPLFYYYYTTYRQRGVVAWATLAPSMQAKLKVTLPNDPMSLRIKQNASAEYPGSSGAIGIHIGDVRRHYTYIRLSLPHAQKTILTKTHVRKGEQVAFRLGKQTYYVSIIKIRRRIVRGSSVLVGVGTRNEATNKQ